MNFVGFNIGHGNSPFLNNSTGWQYSLLLTVDWLGWLC